MPKLPEFVRNPIAYIAARWTPSQRALQRATLAPLVMSVVIVVTGGAVRLTGSGLGCDTWPKCSDDSLVATSEMGLHGVIEFGNRMLTYVLCAAVGWAIIAARAAKPGRPQLSRLAWAQFWVVVGNGVWGGVTVLTKLNPYTVAGHFLLATGLLTLTTLTWLRAREGDERPRPLAGRRIRQLAVALTVVTCLLVVVGTGVTGAGPHAGDSSDVPRMPFDWDTVAQLHSALAWLVTALTIAVWIALRLVDGPHGPIRRARELFLVLVAQGGLGYVQYAIELPEFLVGLHMLGSCLVWIAVLRLLLSLRERGPAPSAAPGTDATGAATAPPAAEDGAATPVDDGPVAATRR
ncbi:heme A synthase [Streptomyces sp. AJS327]|uniref:COX15/CtaA family protein n=1 Tax=Streptomyces sp. AJS327 TaxID=2545265 RepID=UPI001811AB5F|nr:COX15/CtaA family protein [Streptomyces sp. AJS327]MBA0050450.1 heme A synthase [Streptomyces sp. AJS327]